MYILFTLSLFSNLWRQAAGRTFSPTEGHLREVRSPSWGPVEGRGRKSEGQESLETVGLRRLRRKKREWRACMPGDRTPEDVLVCFLVL